MEIDCLQMRGPPEQKFNDWVEKIEHDILRIQIKINELILLEII